MTTPTASSTTPSKNNTGFTTRETARLHHATVTNWTAHRKRALKIRGKSALITTIKVDPRIWKTALELCQGEPRRIQVIDELTIIVHNNPL